MCPKATAPGGGQNDRGAITLVYPMEVAVAGRLTETTALRG